MILVTGFGPFPGVPHNPTAAVARTLDGREVAGRRVVGRVLPVSFARAPALTVRLARELGAELVLGLGVATQRAGLEVECVARRVCGDNVDVDGLTGELAGPEQVPATLDVERLAEALGARLSSDAGQYVCNAWLYEVAGALDVPVGFLHVPPAGVDPEALLAGLEALVGR